MPSSQGASSTSTFVSSRLLLAAELGATYVIDVREQDVWERLAEITGERRRLRRGDHGRPEMAAIAAEALAPLGTAGLIGMPNAGIGETQKGERVHGNN